jgi:hypothetical protein
MAQSLDAYVNGRDAGMLSGFERLRNEAAAIGGIADFWTSLLNIRLNSVPLLDPAAGLQTSIEACRRTAAQVARSVRA